MVREVSVRRTPGEGGAIKLSPCRARWVESANLGATATLEKAGGLVRGGRLAGVTKGQFGLTELLRAVLYQTGPADVVIWCWSIHSDDVNIFAGMRAGGMIEGLTAVIDRSFPTRQPARCVPMVEALGEANIFCTNNHAKVAMVSNRDGWRLVLRSSMNCNRNFRFEQFDIDDDPELFGFWRDLTDHVMRHTRPGVDLLGPQFHGAFKSALGGGKVAADPAEAEDVDGFSGGGMDFDVF